MCALVCACVRACACLCVVCALVSVRVGTFVARPYTAHFRVVDGPVRWSPLCQFLALAVAVCSLGACVCEHVLCVCVCLCMCVCMFLPPSVSAPVPVLCACVCMRPPPPQIPMMFTFPSVKDALWEEKHPNTETCQILVPVEGSLHPDASQVAQWGEQRSGAREDAYKELKAKWQEACLRRLNQVASHAPCRDHPLHHSIRQKNKIREKPAEKKICK